MHTQDREKRTYPFPEFPNGWYVLANSSDINVGDVKSYHYFGKDIVIYRSSNLAVHIVDAYCPHLGAHLGKGGTVVGNNLRCPFHHWQFDESGKCVDIPYSEPQPKACLKHWAAIERNGQIITYFSTDGSAPHCEVPEVNELQGDKFPGWSQSYFSKFEYTAHVQEVVENIVDLGHFIPIHHVEEVPHIDEMTFSGPRATLRYSTKNKVLGKIFKAMLHFEYYGPTYTVVKVKTMTDIVLIASMAPTANGQLRHRFHFRMKNMIPLLNPILLRIMAKQIEHDFMGDLPIWEHKIYREHPILCKGEGAIMKMRNWFKQFYSSETPPTKNAIPLKEVS
ncbi:hypothetical protein A9Q99_27455 [Gammaproteobacteria bacterium 45_16_T64]|nr:hypothetical protein A9Q99_27455 [Gammaproteobacteria bacterium 45_16_T64]